MMASNSKSTPTPEPKPSPVLRFPERHVIGVSKAARSLDNDLLPPTQGDILVLITG